MNLPSLWYIEEALEKQGYGIVPIDKQTVPGGEDLPRIVRVTEAAALWAFQRAILDAADTVRTLQDLAELVRAVQAAAVSGHVEQVVLVSQAEQFGKKIEAAARTSTRASYTRGARVADEDLIKVNINVRFDIINPRAEEYARRESANLVTEVSEDQKLAVRELIRRAVSEGITPQETARQIRNAVGLHSRQIAALMKFRGRLAEQGIEPDKAQSRAARYAKGLLKQRSETIARTEILRAAHEGQRALWDEGVVEGLINPKKTKRTWIATEDDITDVEICEPMDGEEVDFDDDWVLPDGTQVRVPSASHPCCRCTEGLIFD